MATDASEDDRLLVRDGFKHYRRTYSRSELRWGLVTGAAMLAIAAWVAWRGKRPDPALFDDGAALLQADGKGAAAVAVPVAVSPPAAGRGAAAQGAEGAAGPVAVSGAGAGAGKAAARGPIPEGLGGAGWKEEKAAEFDGDNLYVKINGRADYFRAFGFKRLHSILLTNEKTPSETIDIEVYDLGRAANALGAYGGERGAGVKPEVSEAGLRHIDRNALYMARGPYYVRVIGSDETPAIKERLADLAGKLEAGVKGEPLPWAYGLFVGGLGLDPGQVAYYAEAAFSFAFATDVWAARPAGKDSDLEIFVSAHGAPAAAKKRAAQLTKGFLEIGEPAGKIGEGASAAPAVKDRYLNTFAAAAAHGRFVYGVRGAADREAARKELDRLRGALVDSSSDLEDRARPAAAARAARGNEGGEAYE
jgi:hypothetical protein